MGGVGLAGGGCRTVDLLKCLPFVDDVVEGGRVAARVLDAPILGLCNRTTGA